MTSNITNFHQLLVIHTNSHKEELIYSNRINNYECRWESVKTVEYMFCIFLSFLI